MKLQFTIIAILLCSFLYGQTIQGYVYDENGLPLEGATVESKSGMDVTNQLGQFSIHTSIDSLALTFGYLGFESQTKVGIQGKNVSVILKDKNFEISEVNVVAKGNPLSTVAKIDLKTKPVTNSQQLLRRVPGLFIAQHAGGGKAEQIFLRGFDIDHGTDISLSVDGIPVNMVSHAHGQGYADLHFVIPETIKKIDFGKGPYNTDKGNFATAGYVDFTTIDRPDNSFFNLEAGAFNTYRASGIARLTGESVNNIAYVASEYLYSDGPFVSPQGFNRFNLFGKYTHLSNEGNKFSLELSNFTSKWNASGQIPQRLVDNNTISRFGSVDDKEGGVTSRFNANASAVKKLNQKSLWVSNVYYSKYAFDLYSNFTFFLEDPVNGDQIRQKEDRNVYGGKTSLKSNFLLSKFTVNSDIGAGFRYDDINNNELSHTLNRTTTLVSKVLGNLNELNQFAYSNFEFNNGKYTLNAGIRADYFMFKYLDQLVGLGSNPDDKKSIFLLSPKMSFTYQAAKDIQFFMKAGKGFHSNDTRAIVKTNYESVPNTITDILPAAIGTDLGTILKPSKNLIVNAALWFLHLDQEFVYVGDGGIVEPSGRTRRYGFDLGLRNELIQGLFIDWDINYTIARSIDDEPGNNYIPLAPDLTSTGGITYKSNKKINAGISYRFIKNRPATSDNSITAKGYFVSDAVVSYTIGKANVSLIGENIFNTKWNEAQFATLTRLKNEANPVEEIHFTPGNPFFLRLSVAYKL